MPPGPLMPLMPPGPLMSRPCAGVRQARASCSAALAPRPHGRTGRAGAPRRSRSRAATSPIRDERQRDAGQRDQLEVPGRDDERLDAHHEGQPGGEERPEVVVRGGRDAQASLHDDEVEPQDRQQADEPQLLAQGGERIVGVDGRDRQAPADRRKPGAQPHAQDAAPPQGVERLDRLEPGAGRIGPRVQPVVHALLDVAEHVVQDERAGEEQDQSARDVRDPAGRDVQQGEEHGEEQQGGTEVPLDDHDPEGDRPHGHDRREIRDRRQAQGPDPRALLREERAVLGEIGGEEDHEDHLEELRGLARDRADREREPGAVDVAAEDEREQQQADAGGGPRVLVGPQPGVRADRQRQRPDDAGRHQEPDQLEVAETEDEAEGGLHHEVLREALHEEEADAAQHRDGRQQHLVDPASGEDERDVDEADRAEIDREGDGVRRRQVERREGLACDPGCVEPLGRTQGHGPDDERHGNQQREGPSRWCAGGA